MPRFPLSRSWAGRAALAARILLVAALAQSCMEPVYFEGRPPGTATLRTKVRGIDTLDGTLVRARLELAWSIPPSDFAARPHRIDLSDGASHLRRIDLPNPSDTLLDTFVCERGNIRSRLWAVLDPSHLLLLSEQSNSTFLVEP